jgi:hypothetical protein
VSTLIASSANVLPIVLANVATVDAVLTFIVESPEPEPAALIEPVTVAALPDDTSNIASEPAFAPC